MQNKKQLVAFLTHCAFVLNKRNNKYRTNMKTLHALIVTPFLINMAGINSAGQALKGSSMPNVK
jgi:hypothetical protein